MPLLNKQINFAASDMIWCDCVANPCSSFIAKLSSNSSLAGLSWSYSQLLQPTTVTTILGRVLLLLGGVYVVRDYFKTIYGSLRDLTLCWVLPVGVY